MEQSDERFPGPQATVYVEQNSEEMAEVRLRGGDIDRTRCSAGGQGDMKVTH